LVPPPGKAVTEINRGQLLQNMSYILPRLKSAPSTCLRRARIVSLNTGNFLQELVYVLILLCTHPLWAFGETSGNHFLLLADKQAPQRNPFLSDRPATKQRPYQQTTGETFWDYARCGRGLVENLGLGWGRRSHLPQLKRITQGVALYRLLRLCRHEFCDKC